MKSFKEIAEARFVASADFKVSASGRKVHRMKKVADNPEDLDHDGDVDADDKKLAKESVELEEGTVKTSKYSWGTMKHVEHGHSFSIPLHPEHHQAIHKLKDGESHSFTDETKSKWKATREGDKVHFHGASRGNDSYKTTVKHDDLKESHAPVAPVPDRKYIKGTPEWKANKEKNKPRTGHPTNESVDQHETRLIQLARLGLVDKSDVSKLRIAIDQLNADKQLTVQQRTLLLSLMSDLISLVTGDDMIFNRIKRDVQKEDYEIIEEEEIIVETKDNDKDDVPFDGPYTKKPSVKPGKFGSGYSTARHLARLALQKQQQKKQGK